MTSKCKCNFSNDKQTFSLQYKNRPVPKIYPKFDYEITTYIYKMKHNMRYLHNGLNNEIT